jgi:hypothetical protein
MKTCKRGALYLVTMLGMKRPDNHVFTCGKHLGEMVRVAVEQAPRCKVKVAYVPEPGDQPCLSPD